MKKQLEGQDYPAKVRDPKYPHLHLSHEDHQHRAELLANDKGKKGDEAHKYYGCKGEPLLSQILLYVCLDTLFLVPIAHALLYGVIASFVGYAYRKIAKPSKV